MQNCPCGTGKIYTACCGLFISSLTKPATPEELMRSRYTAYTQVNIDYILRTMKSPASDNFDAQDTREWAKKIIWTGLDVVKTSHDELKGIVEFFAYYLLDGKKHILHEISDFIFDNGSWFYISGTQPQEKIGRNDKCPCGSQKKYKKCCSNQ